MQPATKVKSQRNVEIFSKCHIKSFLVSDTYRISSHGQACSPSLGKRCPDTIGSFYIEGFSATQLFLKTILFTINEITIYQPVMFPAPTLSAPGFFR